MDVAVFFRWMERALRPMDIDVRFPPRKLNLRNSVNGLKCGSCRFWQRTDSPPGSNMLRLAYADSGLQTRRGSNHSAAHVGESNSHSNVFQIRRESVCVPSRWKVLSGEFRRRPTALAIKFSKSDRVGRRGLSESREDFSRLLTFAFPWLCLSLLPQFEFCRA